MIKNSNEISLDQVWKKEGEKKKRNEMTSHEDNDYDNLDRTGDDDNFKRMV